MAARCPSPPHPGALGGAEPAPMPQSHHHPTAPQPRVFSDMVWFPDYFLPIAPWEQSSDLCRVSGQRGAFAPPLEESPADLVSNGELAEPSVSAYTGPGPLCKHVLDAVRQNPHFHPRCCVLKKSAVPGHPFLTAEGVSV